VAGIAEADLRINEPLAAGIPARVQGSVAVNRIAVSDARHEVLGAQRVEASGLTLHWPRQLAIDRVLVSGPRGIVERDRAGGFPLKDLVRPAAASPQATGAPPLGVEIGEIVVRNGAVSWRDQTVSPAARLDVASIEASVKGIGWPLRGPAIMRVGARPPGGGRVQVSGRIDLDPIAADLRVAAKDVELAPYQPYLPTPARISGAADFDGALVVPSLAEWRATAQGTAGVSRLDVRDKERTVARVERATATGLDVDWPGRVTVRRLALAQPWLLLERDEKGGLPLRALLPRQAPAAGETTANGGEPLAVTVAQVSVERGGMRVVDRAVSPPFAVDLQSATIGVQGLSTAAATPARLDLSGQLGPGAELALRGTLGALGGPLRLDVDGELREFAVPRTNPYLLEHVGWKTTEGRLTTKLQCRIDGDALSARTSIRLSRLQLVRAAPHDGAQARVGLPLGMLTSLMKDKRGDIILSFPMGGRLGDPRFDFSEAIWSAVRTVAVNAITLPVSWIGRVHFSADSKIERIEVRPVPFEPGTAELTPDGRAHVTRVAAFLDHLPEVRMALTPVISSGDIEAVRRRQFAQRFPDRPVPETMEAILAALQERERVPTAEVRELAARRLDAVRAPLKQAAIDSDRLEPKPAQQDGPGSQVALDVLEPEGPRRSKVRESIGKIRGLIEGGSASP